MAMRTREGVVRSGNGKGAMRDISPRFSQEERQIELLWEAPVAASLNTY